MKKTRGEETGQIIEIYVPNGRHFQLIDKLALEIGLNESIMLIQLEFLLKEPTNGKFVNGNHWIYNSANDWHDKYFGFWSTSTILRIAKSLEEKKLIKIENFNDKKYDKTTWYALNPEGLMKLKSIEVRENGIKITLPSDARANQNDAGRNQNDAGRNQNDAPIPKNTTKNTAKSSVLQTGEPNHPTPTTNQPEPTSSSPREKELGVGQDSSPLSPSSLVPCSVDDGQPESSPGFIDLEVNEILNMFYEKNKSENFHGNFAYRTIIKKLLLQYGKGQLRDIVSIAFQMNGQNYCPVIKNPFDLSSKIIGLQAFLQRSIQEKNKKRCIVNW